jgi:hypothetical protein
MLLLQLNLKKLIHENKNIKTSLTKSNLPAK